MYSCLISKFLYFLIIFLYRAHVPFEELWDEARPAVGAAVQQAAPNPDGTKKSFSDQLASFPRPVDGEYVI